MNKLAASQTAALEACIGTNHWAGSGTGASTFSPRLLTHSAPAVTSRAPATPATMSGKSCTDDDHVDRRQRVLIASVGRFVRQVWSEGRS
jgi:hypothetical protein